MSVTKPDVRIVQTYGRGCSVRNACGWKTRYGSTRAPPGRQCYAGPKRLARCNAEQVSIVRKIVEGLGLEIATPDEAREMLHLKGGSTVSF